MRILNDLSLKKRLALAFAGVVILSALLITLVFTIVLVKNMTQSAREKIRETSRVAMTHIAEEMGGLEIYANLIASNENFGRLLSYDSAGGIQEKIRDFRKLSQADLVAFIPVPTPSALSTLFILCGLFIAIFRFVLIGWFF